MSDWVSYLRSMGWLLFAILVLIGLLIVFFGVEVFNGLLKLLVSALVGLVEDE